MLVVSQWPFSSPLIFLLIFLNQIFGYTAVVFVPAIDLQILAFLGYGLCSLIVGFISSFECFVQEGRSESEVGALRCSKFGGGTQIYEKLVGIDEEKHLM